MNNFARSQGVALITVMLVVALAAVLATQMTARLQLQMQRTANISFNQQAYWYAMGAEAFAKRVLLTAFDKDKDVTHLGQIWAEGETSYPVDYGQITGEITDLQSCLNLNALREGSLLSGSGGTGSGNSGTDTGSTGTSGSTGSKKSKTSKKGTNSAARNSLEELLVILNIDGVSQFEAEYMADALTDWLDENSAIASAGGAEDNDYSSREFPYLSANHFLSSVNELRVVEHFTVPAINALKDYVCVIPNSNLHKININTISAEKPQLLQALLGISQSDAEQVLSAREDEGFEKIDDFFNLPELSKVKLNDDQKEQFVVDSEYFTLKTTASFNNSFLALNSVMKIENNNKVHVISRTIGNN